MHGTRNDSSGSDSIYRMLQNINHHPDSGGKRKGKMATKKEQRLQAAREGLGIEAPAAFKEKKKRKPMTEAQKKKARDNLAKARAAKGPAKNSSVHPNVLALPDDHPLSADRVKAWLKYNQDLLKAIKSQQDSKDWKERREYRIVENYIKNLRIYLKDSVWCDHRYGEKMENKMEYVTIAHGYGVE